MANSEEISKLAIEKAKDSSRFMQSKPNATKVTKQLISSFAELQNFDFAVLHGKAHNNETTTRTDEDQPMASDELTAKLEAIEARSEARTAERFARVDTQLGRFEERLDLSLSHLSKNQERMEIGMQNLSSSISQMKWWMIGTGLTVILGIASFNATVLSNMVASFDSGRETANQNAIASKEIANAVRELRLLKETETSKAVQTPPVAPVAPVAQ